MGCADTPDAPMYLFMYLCVYPLVAHDNNLPQIAAAL